MSKFLIIFLKNNFIIGLILMVASVFFMLLYSIFPLNFSILKVFNAIIILSGFLGGSWYSNIKTKGNNLIIISASILLFSIILIALSLMLGGLNIKILAVKLLFSVLGCLIGTILSQKFYKF